MKCVQFSRDEHFFARPKRSKTSRKKCAKRAQIGAKKCKRAQIQKTLPLNRKRLLTHFYLYLSEHSDTICREKCETTARKNLWRADFSKTSTFSFTSVNLHFRAETQRHVNLRYFGGPRMYMYIYICICIYGMDTIAGHLADLAQSVFKWSQWMGLMECHHSGHLTNKKWIWQRSAFDTWDLQWH